MLTARKTYNSQRCRAGFQEATAPDLRTWLAATLRNLPKSVNGSKWLSKGSKWFSKCSKWLSNTYLKLEGNILTLGSMHGRRRYRESLGCQAAKKALQSLLQRVVNKANTLGIQVLFLILTHWAWNTYIEKTLFELMEA